MRPFSWVHEEREQFQLALYLPTLAVNETNIVDDMTITCPLGLLYDVFCVGCLKSSCIDTNNACINVMKDNKTSMVTKNYNPVGRIFVCTR